VGFRVSTECENLRASSHVRMSKYVPGCIACLMIVQASGREVHGCFRTGEKICLLDFSSSLYFVAASWLRVIDTITSIPTGLFCVLYVFVFEILLILCIVRFAGKSLQIIRSSKLAVLWHVTACGVVDAYKHFRGTSGFHLQDGSGILRLQSIKFELYSTETRS
jgi:hypothetical protein